MKREASRVSWRSWIWIACVVLFGPAIIVSTTVALAAAPGSWSLTGRMVTPRSSNLYPAAATLLQNGKVLIVGGSAEPSAELYDPSLGTWSAAAQPLFQPYSTVLLANGKVLATDDRTAQVYDPTSNSWSMTGAPSPPQGPSSPGLTLLPSGRVLGVRSYGGAELYDPATGSWQLITRIPYILLASGAVLLDSGKVLVNTFGFQGEAAPSVVYDPETATWTPTTGSIIGARTALLTSGNVLNVGLTISHGLGSRTDGTAAVYDPTSNSWTNTSPFLGYPHSLTLLADGRVLAAGGTFSCALCGPATQFGSAAIYDMSTGAWTATGGMVDPQGRPGGEATRLRDGRVLVAGGGNDPTTAEIYTPPVTAAAPMSCKLSLTGTDTDGHAFIRIAARDIASGLKSVQMVQSTNASVVLPRFPEGSRDPGVVTATKIDPSQRSELTLQVTNMAGQSLTCDPVIAELVRQRGEPHQEVFSDLSQAESTLTLSNGTPGLEAVDVLVNRRMFHLTDLHTGETRTLSVAAALLPGSNNRIRVIDHGPLGSSALLVISD